jgi:hypothetical protein
MPRLVKTSGGDIHIAHVSVHTPGYTLLVADAPPPTDGWVYYADDVVTADFVQPWKQPTGAADAYALGALVFHANIVWRSLIVANVWQPGVSGWVDASSDVPAWIQPTGAHDSYSKDAIVSHAGKRWTSLIPANVWQPGVTGWRESVRTPPGATPQLPAWVQPLGAQDAYPLNAQVRHNGFNWKNTGSAANVWEPGVFGWTVV